ncbi:UDP-N-acetylmuramate dehydrogenase [Vreelandella utahensis]|uniref:UDP-N-acetylmuramate dehydrogenase n=1 Tax=Vreelandella halophila TaxID=86177 RepID=UPI00098621E4|nr:UDP-N-acetylmuramate dehydrogenase [Halomonas utahensis]
MNQGVLEQGVDLQSHNTLRLPGQARWFARITDPDLLPELLEWADSQQLPVQVLGGGSNVVLCSDIHGVVLGIAIRECHWQVLDEDQAILTLGAGENWDTVVRYAASIGYRGLENLALIPGTVGAAPIQNIGAYGRDLSDVFESLDAWDRQQARFRTLGPEECNFGYRDSLFKRDPERFIIVRVRVRLSRSAPFRLDYGELAREVADHADLQQELTPEAIADTVSRIRLAKLPDPAVLPNAGSFFKNPVVDQATGEALRQQFPGLVAHPDPGGLKLAAGWLIEQCGWKGHREAHVGVHSKQALVLIHHGNGTGAELLALAGRIREDVRARFGVTLEIEPRLIGNEG